MEEEFNEQDFGVPLLRNRMLNETFVETVPVILKEDDLNVRQSRWKTALHF